MLPLFTQADKDWLADNFGKINRNFDALKVFSEENRRRITLLDNDLEANEQEVVSLHERCDDIDGALEILCDWVVQINIGCDKRLSAMETVVFSKPKKRKRG